MKRNIVYLLTLILVSATLAGCGSGSSNASYAKEDSFAEAAYATDDVYASSGYADYEYAEEEMIAEGESANGGLENTPDSQIKNSDRKIIKTVNITTETEEFDALIENISKKVTALDGYLESTDISGRSLTSSSKQRRNASITARIPSSNLDQFVTIVNDTSNITYKTENAEDVTLSYADTKAKIESLRTEQTRLNELIMQAEDIDTLIILEERLTEVRYEIESYESRLRTMDNKVDYSTVYLQINEVEKYTEDPIIEKTMGQRIAEGFSESLEDAGELFEDFVVGFISALPRLIVILFILLFIAFIIFLVIKLIISLARKVSGRSSKKAKDNKKTLKASKKDAAEEKKEDEVKPSNPDGDPYGNPVAKEDKQ